MFGKIKIMNLYLITCNGDYKTNDVYVLAENETEASKKAIEKMPILQYQYCRYVSKIILIASDDNYKADFLLVK